ncbi:MAG: glycine dehydrogenase, partial [Candidatus Dormibacteraceae bacterium]
LPGIEMAFPGADFLFEFPLRIEHGGERLQRLGGLGILAGLQVGRWYPELRDVTTFCCTEVNDPGAIDELVAAMADWRA